MKLKPETNEIEKKLPALGVSVLSAADQAGDPYMNNVSDVSDVIHVQGRDIDTGDIALIKNLIHSNPNWKRTHLSYQLCLFWNWRNAAGHLKDMSCRILLRKLEKMGYVELPVGVHSGNNTIRHVRNKIIEPVLHSKEPIAVELKELLPLQIRVVEVEDGYDLKLFKYFISAHHYLGWRAPVGEHLKYFVLDNQTRPLACLMFGAAAWRIEPRDIFIGWSPAARKRNLNLIANNNRFLILPWVEVKCLASHILGLIGRRINHDWQQKYHHEIYMLETFVEDKRFLGTSYNAANWVYLGKTQGRGRNDVKQEYKLPIKNIWVYTLSGNFREKLRNFAVPAVSGVPGVPGVSSVSSAFSAFSASDIRYRGAAMQRCSDAMMQ